MGRHDLIVAGFGGQGVLLAGSVLAWAGMLEGLNVTWFPSYGAEMRGGTANCTVILSEREIGSPMIGRPMALIAMNEPSADRFSGSIKRGGLMVLNSSLVKRDYNIKGVKIIRVPANDIAAELGNPRVLNMAMLGAYLGATGAVKLRSAVRALDENLPAHKKDLLAVNSDALLRGLEVSAEKKP